MYVKNLESDFTENLLREKFSEYGNVTSAVIMSDADGKSRGFGFVNFESHDSAKKAIEALNGVIIGTINILILHRILLILGDFMIQFDARIKNRIKGIVRWKGHEEIRKRRVPETGS